MTERTDEASLPAIYGVNWFRKDADGKFLWPGFGENSRVLEWICRRLDGDAGGADTADRRGARAPTTSTSTASTCRRPTSPPRSRSTPTSGSAELPGIREYFAEFGDRLPPRARRASSTRSKHASADASRAHRRRSAYDPPTPASRRNQGVHMSVTAYVLIQTEVGKAGEGRRGGP